MDDKERKALINQLDTCCDELKSCETCPAYGLCSDDWENQPDDELLQMKKAFSDAGILAETVSEAAETFRAAIPDTEPHKTEAPQILDSGNRTEYSTGAVRDCKEGKGRCDLMPLDVVAFCTADSILDDIARFKEKSDVSFLAHAFETFGISHDWTAWEMLLEVSKHFEEGAKKYGPNNWQKGIPVHSYVDSAVRHYLKYRAGWTDEPHDRAFVWNLMCCIWTMKHHPELDDFTDKKETVGNE